MFRKIVPVVCAALLTIGSAHAGTYSGGIQKPRPVGSWYEGQLMFKNAVSGQTYWVDTGVQTSLATCNAVLLSLVAAELNKGNIQMQQFSDCKVFYAPGYSPE